MSPVDVASPTHEAHHGTSAIRRLSETMLDALHLPHGHRDTGGHAAPPPCQLAEAVLANVKRDMGDAFGAKEASFCDAPCLQRYLRARNMDVTKASAMLLHTLEWRKEMNIDDLRLSDYQEFIDEGWMYLLGNDDVGNTMMMLRKRKTRIDDSRLDNFLGFFTVLLESSIRNMKDGAERWNWVFDMANYDTRNSPRFDYTLKVLQLVANHYPERLNKVYIIDAPTIFWVLFKGVSPFLDHVTKAKVQFVYSKDVSNIEAAAAAAAGPAPAKGAPAVAPYPYPDTPEGRFVAAGYQKWHRQPFDRTWQWAKLRELGWKE